MDNVLTVHHKMSVNTMSLLGPDDFDLDGKGRKKKLAKDLSPAVRKEIEKWLDRQDDPHSFDRLVELVGYEEAQRLTRKHRRRGRKLLSGERLLDD